MPLRWCRRKIRGVSISPKPTRTVLTHATRDYPRRALRWHTFLFNRMADRTAIAVRDNRESMESCGKNYRRHLHRAQSEHHRRSHPIGWVGASNRPRTPIGQSATRWCVGPSYRRFSPEICSRLVLAASVALRPNGRTLAFPRQIHCRPRSSHCVRLFHHRIQRPVPRSHGRQATTAASTMLSMRVIQMNDAAS